MQLSKFLLDVPTPKKSHIMYNTLYGFVIELEAEFYSKLYTDGLKSGTLLNEFLLKNKIVMEHEEDEDRHFHEYKKARLSRRNMEIGFLTTENCNFHCTYCYETH